MRLPPLRTACALMLLSAALPRQALPAGPAVSVEGMWARNAPMMAADGAKVGAGNGAVYATLVNAGKEPDALVGADSDAAAIVEIHETYAHKGMMMMRPVPRIDLPAGKRVEMKPGGYHIMLMQLRRDLKAGESIAVTLRFRGAGSVSVAVPVR